MIRLGLIYSYRLSYGRDSMRAKSDSARLLLSRWALAAPLLTLCWSTGCDSGDGLNRQAVSGAVTLDGQPLDSGTIHFRPTSNDAGTEVSTSISGGKYSFQKSDGPVPGNYRVEVSSAKDTKFEPPAGKTPGEFLPPAAKETVPDKYNIKTTLSATIKPGQSEPVDFKLTSK
jgi:hypothetical protein